MKRATLSVSLLLFVYTVWMLPSTAHAAACTPDWTVTMTATDARSSPTSAKAVFGVGSGATANNDGVGCDVQAPPSPPSSVYATFSSADNTPLLTDIRANNQPNQWTMNVSLNSTNDYPLVLSWDQATLTGSGTYLLTNDTYIAALNDVREPLTVDMRSASSATFYQLSGGAASVRDRTFSIVYTPLTVSKSADNTPPNFSQTINYTVVLANNSSADVTGVTITDTVPTGLSFVNGSTSLTGASAGTTGNAPNLASGVTVPANSQVTLTYQMSVSATTIGTTITNIVNVISTGINKPITANATVTTADSIAPVLSLPSNMTVEATSSSGATVTYSATATDAVDASPVVVCSPASGSTFAIATTTVNCTATDASNNQSSGSFTVLVNDTTAPALTLPSTINKTTTNRNGTTATFSVTATDAVSSSPIISCSSTSGSTFAVGTTTVNCTATDDAGNQAAGSFQIVVVYQTTVTTSAGWNLLSIPLVADNMAVSAMFPEATAAYEYNGGGYIVTNTFTPGTGYWVHFPSGKTYTIQGQPYNGVGKVAVQSGWNLIGPYDSVATTFFIQSPNALESSFFGYSGSGYQSATSLNPWQGYWVKVTSNGELFYNGSQARRGTAINAPMACTKAWNAVLTVTDSAGNQQHLEIGTSATATTGTDTGCDALSPPAAPEFDAVLSQSGDRLLTDIRPTNTGTHVFKVDVTLKDTTKFPITISWNSADFPSAGTTSVQLLDDLSGVTGNAAVDMKTASTASYANALNIKQRTFTIQYNDATAVTLDSFSATQTGAGEVTVMWTTSAEIDHAGFNIYRRAANSRAAWESINSGLIASRGVGGQGANYQFTDQNVTNGAWEYLLEDVENDGDRYRHTAAIVQADVQLLTVVALSEVGANRPIDNPMFLVWTTLLSILTATLIRSNDLVSKEAIHENV